MTHSSFLDLPSSSSITIVALLISRLIPTSDEVSKRDRLSSISSMPSSNTNGRRQREVLSPAGKVRVDAGKAKSPSE